ncbi:hypothetical protein QYH69_12265 [Paraburkholderia sp. SARCC-3016]|uniref:hypothetical protein n=1 Tax=Paraburkholderia sp. SARCC-3016 TaxID=3058611 RepID=UPI00280806F9|nr:hypothetical protein [Paraburkholderia sp. SARCC-3016]MDQ7978015.1 hypothetical protein [Paraburkholderia sp. SARCC-3016]
MKSGPIRRFSICALTVALTCSAANAAGVAAYAGNTDAGFVMRWLAHFEAKNPSTQQHDVHLTHIAEQIASGRSTEIEALKKVSVPPRAATKAPIR